MKKVVWKHFDEHERHTEILRMSYVSNGGISHTHFALREERWRKHSEKRLRIPEGLVESFGKEDSN